MFYYLLVSKLWWLRKQLLIYYKKIFNWKVCLIKTRLLKIVVQLRHSDLVAAIKRNGECGSTVSVLALIKIQEYAYIGKDSRTEVARFEIL